MNLINKQSKFVKEYVKKKIFQFDDSIRFWVSMI